MDTDVNIMSYCVDPLFPRNALFVVMMKNGDVSVDVTVEALTKMEGPIITYDVWRLVEHFRKVETKLPRCLLDISLLSKMTIGLPASECGDKQPWEINNLISELVSQEAMADFGRLRWGADALLGEPGTVLVEVARALRSIFGSFDEKLVEQYFQRELPVANVFYGRQFDGIRVDLVGAENHLREVEDEYYSGMQGLRDDHSFRGGVFDYSYLHNYFIHNSLLYQEYAGIYSMREYLDYFFQADPLAGLIRNLRRLHISRNCLLKIVGSGEGRLYPIFDTIGTVTGRITVKEPLLQQLRKRDRHIIIADDGKKLIYLDYKEFEPRILAALSSDDRLISLIETGHLYESISDRYFRGLLSRDQAKVVMMQLSYGATEKSVARYASVATGASIDEMLQAAIEMFASFPQLSSWKKGVIDLAEGSRAISTKSGIIRRFPRKKHFTERMKRQSVNHLIQGAGTEVLKVGVVAALQYSDIELLLPMHDAILAQVPEEQSERNLETLRECMLSAFSELSDSIDAVVVLKDFAETV